MVSGNELDEKSISSIKAREVHTEHYLAILIIWYEGCKCLSNIDIYVGETSNVVVTCFLYESCTMQMCVKSQHCTYVEHIYTK